MANEPTLLESQLDEMLSNEGGSDATINEGTTEGSLPTIEGENNPSDGNSQNEEKPSDDDSGKDAAVVGDTGIDPIVKTDPVVSDISKDLIEQNKQLMAIVKNFMEQNTKKAEVVAPVEKDLLEEETFKDLLAELGLDEVGGQKFGAFFKMLQLKTVKDAVDQAMRVTPNLINDTITTKETMQEIKRKFYDEHKILNEFQPLVSQVAKQIAQENPSLILDEVLKKTAEKAYKVLSIDPKKINAKTGNETGKRENPGFATTTGSRKAPDKLTLQEQELADMLALDM